MAETPITPEEDDLPEQLRIRREKRAGLLERGVDPYPVSVPRTKSLARIRAIYSDLAIDVATGDIESVTGRIIFKRDTGKLCFATLREGDGTTLQAMISLDKVGEEFLSSWKSDIDLGDIVSVTGEIITSKRGELSILANDWALASKSLRPLRRAATHVFALRLCVRCAIPTMAEITWKLKHRCCRCSLAVLRPVLSRRIAMPMTWNFSYVLHPNCS
jgi:lysyl-tRNA synthetase class II